MPDVNGQAPKSAELTAIRFGNTLLGVPKDEVTSIHLANDVQRDAGSPQDGWGGVQIESEMVRVYSLSEALVPIGPSENGMASNYCIALSPTSFPRFALTGDFVQQIPPEHSEPIMPMPTSMQTENTPIVGFALYSDSILFVSTADNLAKYLASVGNEV